MELGLAPVFEIVTPASLAADPSFWALYDEAFPIEEREPRDVILRTAEGPGSLVACLRASGRTVGLATLQWLPSVAWAFLVYLGIDASRRGQGLGSRMMAHLAEAARARFAGCQGIVWEIDDPARATTDAERRRRENRERFFAHTGGARVAVPYAQPPLTGGAPVPMLLVALPLDPAAPADGLALRRAIYRDKYGAVNGLSDSVLRATEASVGRAPVVRRPCGV